MANQWRAFCPIIIKVIKHLIPICDVDFFYSHRTTFDRLNAHDMKSKRKKIERRLLVVDKTREEIRNAERDLSLEKWSRLRREVNIF